jgi:hypothetical protein
MEFFDPAYVSWIEREYLGPSTKSQSTIKTQHALEIAEASADSYHTSFAACGLLGDTLYNSHEFPSI